MSSTKNMDRFSRQAELVPREKLIDLTATVIGIGAIGRQVASQLAALGVPRMQLIDFDIVESTNVTTQCYESNDIGNAKVVATANAVYRIDPKVEVETVYGRFRSKLKIGQAVFCCVDSISAREAIWRTASKRCEFWCDGRMLGEVIRVLTVADAETRRHYPSTLFLQSEAVPGRCTAAGTIFTAAIAGSMMTHQFTRWLRKQPVDAELSLNLAASELVVADAD